MSGPSPTDQDSTGDARRAGLFRRGLQSPREALQPDDAPAPPPPPPNRSPRRRGALSAVSGFLSFLLFAAVAAVGGLIVMQQQIRAPGPLTADKVVVIAPRSEVQEILAQLETEGVVENPLLLNLALLVEGNRSRVRAGEYLFKQHASMRDVIDTLVSGKEILHSITIPEGLTSEQIVERLRDNDLLTGDIRETPKEGSLLPETYRVPRGMSRLDLLRKMQEDQKKVLEQVWSRRSGEVALHSPYELVTLASIVEKETGRADERPRVAGVFLNRLAKRMKLQSDPTIVYGLVGGKGTLGRGILRSEVDRPTPYNTYVVEGLPPGPIANPGRAAMEAVANPSRTRELYFVADGTGGHVFAETLDQHNRNVARWRQIEKDARDKQAQPPTVIDHVVPDAAPGAQAPRDQRGELADPAAPGQAAAAQQSARFKGLSFAAPDVGGAFDPVTGKAHSLLDGPVDSPAPGNAASVPLSPARLAEQRARAAKYGLPAGDTDPPPAAYDDPASDPPPPKVVRIYDASEGTPLDPLKNKTWDLNSPKVVPDMGPPLGADGKPAGKPAKAAAKPAAKAKVAKVAKPAHAKPAAKPAPAAAAADQDQ